MKETNIFLIGFMGAGKSSAASYLHACCGKEWIEMDRRIEEQEGKSITRIFREEGEEYFRRKETEFLLALPEDKGLVVSCGGGVPMREENVKAMRSKGRIVWLYASPETVYQRVHRNHKRPLLEGNMNVDYIRSLMEERLQRYEAAADITVVTDDKTTEEIGKEIMERLTAPEM